jgi:hypothetical protein
VTSKLYTRLISLTFLALTNLTFPQASLKSYIEVGDHQASRGTFIRNVYRLSDSIKGFQLGAGTQLDIHSNHNPNFISGVDFFGARQFKLKGFPLTAKGHYMISRFSDVFRESNWGVRVQTNKFQHFTFSLGYNFKTYIINKTGRDTYDIDKEDARLSENFSLIYTATAFLMKPEHKWNLGLSGTNQDYYLINQSTNPLFNLQFHYKKNSNLTYFFWAWYKQAGILNISANYFGHTLRGGLKWDF